MKKNNDNENKLLNIFKDVLKNKEIEKNDNFFENGGDSISMLICISRANESGINIFYEDFQINPCASYLANMHEKKQSPIKSKKETNSIPLLPIQKRFFNKPNHSSQVKLIPYYAKLTKSTNIDTFKNSCQILLSYHDALTLRFKNKNGEWIQYIKSNDNFYFDYIDLSVETKKYQKLKYKKYIDKQLSEFSLKNGHLVKFLIINTADDNYYHFVIAAHHLCFDGFSHLILLEDIERIYKKISFKGDWNINYQTSSFKNWANFVKKYSESINIAEHLDSWRKKINRDGSKIPTEAGNEKRKNISLNTSEYKKNIKFSLSKKITLIHKISKKTSVLDILLTSFILVLNEFTNQNSHLIDIRRHGRDYFSNEINITKTVGWLTIVYPVLFCVANNLSIAEALKNVHAQFFNVPENGISYGALRYHSNENVSSKIESLPKAKIAFNYHGFVDFSIINSKIFSFLKKTVANNIGTKATRTHLLNIDIMIHKGKIKIIWTYNKKFHKRSTIIELQNKYENNLKLITDFLEKSIS